MNTLQLQIQQRHVLAELTGVSGIEYIAPHVYLIGDDMPDLIRTSLAFEQFERVMLLAQADRPAPAAMHKSHKADFEALTHYQQDNTSYLLVLGSGARPTRRFAYQVQLPDLSVQPLPLESLYQTWQNSPALVNGAELNIEAVCADTTYFYIFQRGNTNQHHAMLQVKIADFLTQADTLQATHHLLNVPMLGKHAAGISGACWLGETAGFLYTASVEATANAYDDGAILGSFVGWQSAVGQPIVWQLLTTPTGAALPIKVEGISVVQKDSMGCHALLVTDSDGQASEVLHIRLAYPAA